MYVYLHIQNNLQMQDSNSLPLFKDLDKELIILFHSRPYGWQKELQRRYAQNYKDHVDPRDVTAGLQLFMDGNCLSENELKADIYQKCVGLALKYFNEVLEEINQAQNMVA